MNDLERLYRVQEHDSTLDRLLHRRSALAERARLAALEAELVQVDRGRRRAEDQQGALVAEQERLEAEVASCAAKRADLRRRIATGTVPRELQAWSAEEESVAGRQSQLEDELLEVLERVEELEAEAAALTSRREALDGESAEVRRALAEAEAAIDAEVEVARAGRAEAAAAVPEPLLGRYDKLRARLGGVAVARLEAGRCSGCNLQLSTMAVEEVRSQPADAFPECEECGRWLVR